MTALYVKLRKRLFGERDGTGGPARAGTVSSTSLSYPSGADRSAHRSGAVKTGNPALPSYTMITLIPKIELFQVMQDF